MFAYCPREPPIVSQVLGLEESDCLRPDEVLARVRHSPDWMIDGVECARRFRMQSRSGSSRLSTVTPLGQVRGEAHHKESHGLWPSCVTCKYKECGKCAVSYRKGNDDADHEGVVARIGLKSATLGQITERLPLQCRTSTTPRAATTSQR